MPDTLTILSSAGLSTLLSATLVFLFKNWISERLKNAIKHEYDQKLETHKAQLKCESDKAIEQLKAQLQIAAAERSIRLSKVFEHIAETVATTYGKLVEFQKAVKDYTELGSRSDFAQDQELRKAIRSKWEDVLEYFLPRKIYLPKETAPKIIYFLNMLQSTFGAYGMMLSSKGNSDARKELYQKFNECDKEVSVVLAILEEDFRRILGSEERKPITELKSMDSKSQ